MLYRFQYVFYVLVLMVCSVHTKNIYQKLNNIYREEHYFSSGVFSQHDSNKQDAGWYVSVDHVDSGSQSNQIVH